MEIISVKGKVVKGSGDGRKLGFPTVNLQLYNSPNNLQTGVYASKIIVGGQEYNSVTHYGPRQVFDEIENKFEVHILDFDQDVYGKDVDVKLLFRTRPTMDFDSLDGLITQIKEDIKSAEYVFKIFDNKIGLVIGRFQPLHKGHIFLIKEALKISEYIYIGIGSVDSNNKDNPISFEGRKKLLEKTLEHEGLSDKVIKILALEDYPGEDDKWLEEVLDQMVKLDLFVGNHEWVYSIFQDAGYEILVPKFYKRDIYEGQQIRELIRTDGKWEDRVPEYLIKDISAYKNVID